MDCLICKELERTLDARSSEYIGARCAAYYAVSTELAAYKNVEMERARSNLEEHQLVCVSTASGPREPAWGAQVLNVITVKAGLIVG